MKQDRKSKRRLEREVEKVLVHLITLPYSNQSFHFFQLQAEINSLNEMLRTLQNASGDTSRLSEELISYRNVREKTIDWKPFYCIR